MNATAGKPMVSVMAIVLASLAVPAYAQPVQDTQPVGGDRPVTSDAAAPEQPAPEPPAADGIDVNEIVVTANKRSERLSRVGLTVTAFTGEALAERQVVTLQDVASVVPGLAFSQSANNTPILTLRGIGFNESSLGVYPAVSVYLDQAPLPFPVLASHSAYDLERVEVLKGPQGTLFGQNSTGGAINFIAAKPTRDIVGGGDLSFGRFNQLDGNAYISGPLSPTVRARLAFNGRTSDGWQISNTRPDDRNGKMEYVAGRFLLDWDATEALRFSFNVNGWHDTSEPIAGQFILLFPQNPTSAQPQSVAQPFSRQSPRYADWSTGDLTPRSNRKFYQGSLRADLDVSDDLILTSLTSYVGFNQQQTSDGDGSALNISDLASNSGRIRSFSQEVRAANGPGSALRYVVGANYEDSRTFEDQQLRYLDNSSFAPGFAFIFQSDVTNSQKIRNYAGFANVEYDLAPQLTLRAAGRYTNTRNRTEICEFDLGDGRLNTLFTILGTVLGNRPFTPLSNAVPPDQRCVFLNSDFVPSGTPFQQTLKEDNISWRAGVDYRASAETLFYANASRGYKAGSFPVLAAGTDSQYAPVTQERVTAFEAGVKASLLDRRVQVNAAAFYYSYKDKQILGKTADPVFNILDILINVPKSRVIGAEAEVTVRPFDGLTLAGAATYLDTRVQRYVGVNVLGQRNIDFSGEDLPFSPKLNYSFNADYRFETEAGAPFVGVSVNGRSRSDTAVGGSNIAIPPTLNVRLLPGLTRPFTTNAYATVDARVGFEGPDGRYRVTLFGRNVFNKYYWTNVVTSSDANARYAGMPATYGVSVGFKLGN